MSNADLIALAERVEAATGPDRELDARIWCALNGKRYRDHFAAWNKVDTAVEYTEPPKRTRCVTRDHQHAKPYTASIDAAFTLAPVGAWGDVGTRHDGTGYAELLGVTCASTTAATPALALTSAALRARISPPNPELVSGQSIEVGHG